MPETLADDRSFSECSTELSVATRTPMMIRVVCTRTTHSFQTLTTLNLGGHEIGAAVVEQLAHALEVNQVRWTFYSEVIQR